MDCMTCAHFKIYEYKYCRLLLETISLTTNLNIIKKRKYFVHIFTEKEESIDKLTSTETENTRNQKCAILNLLLTRGARYFNMKKETKLS